LRKKKINAPRKKKKQDLRAKKWTAGTELIQFLTTTHGTSGRAVSRSYALNRAHDLSLAFHPRPREPSRSLGPRAPNRQPCIGQSLHNLSSLQYRLSDLTWFAPKRARDPGESVTSSHSTSTTIRTGNRSFALSPSSPDPSRATQLRRQFLSCTE